MNLSQNQSALKTQPSEQPIIESTSFLSCIIQFLYNAEMFRELLIQAYANHEELQEAKLGKLLGLLFKYFKEGKKDQNRLHLLLLSIYNIIKLYLKDYTFQEILFHILSLIENKHANIVRFFDIQYRQDCHCKKSILLKHKFLPFQQNYKCSTCHGQIRTVIVSQPHYLIYTTSKISQLRRFMAEDGETVSIQTKKVQNWKYIFTLRSLIVNKEKGQCFSIHFQQDTYVQIKGLQSNRKDLQNINLFGDNLILLYEFKMKIPLNQMYQYIFNCPTISFYPSFENGINTQQFMKGGCKKSANCLYCFDPFSFSKNTNDPKSRLLLECNHQICLQCYKELKQKCFDCNSVKKIKKIELKNQPSNKQYHFFIKIGNQQSLIHWIPGSFTIKELFQMIPNFESYKNNNKLGVLINSNNPYANMQWNDLQKQCLKSSESILKPLEYNILTLYSK